MKRLLLLIAIVACCTPAIPAAPMAWPVQVSANGRHFVDHKGRPVFWLGTTQWELFRGYTREDAQLILDKSKDKGFVFVQTMLVGVGDGTRTNVYGQKPWLNDDPLTPNEAYFRNVDAVLQAAGERDLILYLMPYHQTCRKHITVGNARAWAKWLAQRYKETPNIVWSLIPEAKLEFVPLLRELAAGLREGDGGAHLITVEPDPSPYSSSFIHGEKWLDFNSLQTWKGVELIYPMVTHDYNLQPTKPVLMAEGAYEQGSEYGFEVTPLWIRRQAYYSYLAGGHHAYGHNDSWRILPTWRQALDAPGARQMGILRKIFEARPEWWRLVPDQSLFAAGGQTKGRVLHLAARDAEGQWAMIYLADPAEFSVDLARLQGPHVRASWVNPAAGESGAAGAYANTGVQSFTTPVGWEDSLLILESWADVSADGATAAAVRPEGRDSAALAAAIQRSEAGTGDTSWMNEGRYGIFLHYQYRILLGYSIKTEPQFPNPSQMTAEGWNRFVDGFDVKGFAQQMVDAKVAWVLFCLDDHYFAWPCAPNPAFSDYTGYAPGRKCSRRDLILELADALNARGVKLICYFAGLNGYMKEPKVLAGLMDGDVGRGGMNDKTPPSAECRRRRLAILKEYADRYQDKIAGWWFDGMQRNTYTARPNDWRTIESIVHTANPKAVIAFSYGANEQACVCPGVDDYTGGDTWSKQDLQRLTPQHLPAQEGILWHGKIYCGNVYHGQGAANQFSDQELIDWINTCNRQGGVCTLDWPFDPQTGLLKDFGLAQLKRIARAVK